MLLFLRFELLWWTPRILIGDPLHLIYLGFGRAFVGSFLKLLIKSCHFGSGSFEHLQEIAFNKFRAWCRKCKRSLALKSLDLHSAKKYEQSGGKGSDIKLMIAWVAEESISYAGPNAELLQVAAVCLAKPDP